MGKKKNHEPNIQKGLMVLLSALYQVFCCSEKDFFLQPLFGPLLFASVQIRIRIHFYMQRESKQHRRRLI